MAASPAGRRLVAFRLADIPKGVLLDAYDKLLKTDGSKDETLVPSRTLGEKVALGIAVERPSDRVYWISRQAWDTATRKRLWKAGR